MKWLSSAILALWFALSGCASRTPIDAREVTSPQFQAIYEAYHAAFTTARDSAEREWHSGWIGNLAVHTLGEAHRGLCWEWRDLTYAAIAPAAERVQWDAVGIHINRGSRLEHNAVVVFDPRLFRRGQLLPARDGEPRPIYVLDPWLRGRPDVYLLDDWVRGASRKSPPQIETPPFQVGTR